jgi:N-methylhydantoinase A
MPERHRMAVMAAGAKAARVPVYARAGLALGQRVAGPAIVTQMDSTTVVLEGQIVEAGAFGVLRIAEAGA